MSNTLEILMAKAAMLKELQHKHEAGPWEPRETEVEREMEAETERDRKNWVIPGHRKQT